MTPKKSSTRSRRRSSPRHGFLDGSILRASNLLWLLRKPDESRVVIDDAIRLGDDDRNHSLRTFRATIEVMAAEPTVAIETMATVDYDQLDDFGRIVGCAAETIALGDLGRVDGRRCSGPGSGTACWPNRRRKSRFTAQVWRSFTPTR